MRATELSFLQPIFLNPLSAGVTDRQTECGQADRQTDRRTDGHIDRVTNKQTNRHYKGVLESSEFHSYKGVQNSKNLTSYII